MLTSTPEQIGPPSGASQAAEEQLDIRTILRVAWGYKWLVASIVSLFVGGTLIVLQQITPRYTATAILLIKPPEKNVINVDEVVEGLDTKSETVRGEILVLRSRELTAKALERLPPLESQSEGHFFSHLNPWTYLPAEWRLELIELVRDAKASVLGQPPAAIPSDREREERHKQQRVDEFLERLNVAGVRDTRAVSVSFTLEHPQLAASAANTLADIYIRTTVEVKNEGTREAKEWLKHQLDDLRAQVQTSEAEFERLRQREAMEGRNVEMVSDQIFALNEQLANTNSELTRFRIQFQQVRSAGASPKRDTVNGAVIRSEFLDALRVEKLQLQNKAAELGSEYGSQHPQIISITSRIDNINDLITDEIQSHVNTIAAEIAAHEARETSLNKLVAKLTNEIGQYKEAEVRLKALEREAEANRNMYQAVLTRYKETSVQEGIQQPDARVISYAAVPTVPSYPRAGEALIFSTILGTLISLGMVYAIEKLQNGFRTERELEQYLALPVLTHIPLVPKGSNKSARPENPENQVNQQPTSRYAEAINLMYANLASRWEDRSSRAVLVTSALPGEGKTSTAIALARRSAMMGERCLIVDCDFRRPQLQQRIGVQGSPGLREALAGLADLPEIVQSDPASTASVLTVGAGVSEPVGLVHSEEFQKLIEALKERYTMIVIDSSPILAVPEPQILAAVVDETVLLVRWRKTPRQSVLAAVKQLENAGVQVSGVALSQIDPRKQSRYGYGEYGYYTEQMKAYYAG